MTPIANDSRLLDIMKNPTFAGYWFGTLVLQIVFQTQTLLFAWSWSAGQVDAAFWVYVASNAPFAILTLFVGYLGDRYSRKGLHFIGQILIGVGCVLSAVYFMRSPSFALGLSALLILNAGIAIRGPSYQATIISLFGKDDVDAVLSVHGLAVSIAKLAGPLFVAYVIHQSLTALPALVGIVASLWTVMVIVVWDKAQWRTTIKTNGVDQAPPTSRINLTSVKNLLLVGALAFGCCSVQTLLPSLVRLHYGDNATRYTLLMVFFGVGALLGTFSGRFSIRLFGRYEEVVLTLIFSITTTLLALTSQVVIHGLALLFCGCALFILFVRLCGGLTRASPPDQRAFRLSLYFFSNYLGGTLGAVAWGLIARFQGANSAMLIASILVLLLGSIMFNKQRCRP
jgi:predicted MFS family arabinose efflux permease